jgi:hypothetical protein
MSHQNKGAPEARLTLLRTETDNNPKMPVVIANPRPRRPPRAEERHAKTQQKSMLSNSTINNASGSIEDEVCLTKTKEHQKPG